MNKIENLVYDLASPVVESLGIELWDVEYVTEAGQKYLRVFLDGPDGIDIDICEKVSRLLDPILDEKDPIPDSYIFEVGSAGLERQLKKPSDYMKFIGSDVQVKLYHSIDGSKIYKGKLISYDDGNVTVDDHCFEKKSIASVHLYVEF